MRLIVKQLKRYTLLVARRERASMGLSHGFSMARLRGRVAGGGIRPAFRISFRDGRSWHRDRC